MNSSNQSPATPKSIFKPGGTMIGTRGNWSGRAIQLPNDQSKDKIGRWTVTHLRGKSSSIITVLSVYQVCHNGETGENTAYLQQQADLYAIKGNILDPRKELCKDLKKTLTLSRQKYSSESIIKSTEKTFNFTCCRLQQDSRISRLIFLF